MAASREGWPLFVVVVYGAASRGHHLTKCVAMELGESGTG